MGPHNSMLDPLAPQTLYHDDQATYNNNIIVAAEVIVV